MHQIPAQKWRNQVAHVRPSLVIDALVPCCDAGAGATSETAHFVVCIIFRTVQTVVHLVVLVSGPAGRIVARWMGQHSTSQWTGGSGGAGSAARPWPRKARS